MRYLSMMGFASLLAAPGRDVLLVERMPPDDAELKRKTPPKRPASPPPEPARPYGSFYNGDRETARRRRQMARKAAKLGAG